MGSSEWDPAWRGGADGIQRGIHLMDLTFAAAHFVAFAWLQWPPYRCAVPCWSPHVAVPMLESPCCSPHVAVPMLESRFASLCGRPTVRSRKSPCACSLW